MERDSALVGASELRQQQLEIIYDLEQQLLATSQTEKSKLNQKLTAEVGLGNKQNSLLSKLEAERRSLQQESPR